MNKFFTKIAALSVGLAMAIGVGVAVGSIKESSKVLASPGDTATYEFHFASGSGNTWGTSSSTSSGTKFKNVTWVTTLSNAGSYNNGYAGQQFGTSKSSGSVIAETKENWGEESTATVYYGKTEVTSIDLWLNNGSGTINTYDVKVDGVSCSKSGTISKKTDCASDYSKTSKITFTPVAGHTSGKIRIQVATSSKAFYFAGIDIYCIEPESESAELTGLRIASGEPNKLYEPGQSFDGSGLVVYASWDGVEDTSKNVLTNVVWNNGSTLTAGTNKTISGYHSNDTNKDFEIQVTGVDVVNPDFTHTYSSNTMFGSTSADASNTKTHTPTSGPEYITLGGYNYTSGSTMSLKNTSGMYVGNNDAYSKYIRRIVIVVNGATQYSAVKMYEGPTALSEATEVTQKASGDKLTLTYDFSDTNQYFKFKSTSGTYINMSSFKVFLGSTPVTPIAAGVDIDTPESVYVGKTLQLSATVSYSNHADDNKVTWAVTSGDGATVNSSTGLVTATGTTATTITATSVFKNSSDQYETDYVVITPLANPIVDVAWDTSGAKKQYNIGDTLDISGVTATGTNAAGDDDVALTLTADNFSGFDSSEATESQTITVSYPNTVTPASPFTTTYTISVVAAPNCELIPSDFKSGGYTVNDDDGVDSNVGGIHFAVKDAYLNSSKIQVKATSGTFHNSDPLGQYIQKVEVSVTNSDCYLRFGTSELTSTNASQSVTLKSSDGVTTVTPNSNTYQYLRIDNNSTWTGIVYLKVWYAPFVPTVSLTGDASYAIDEGDAGSISVTATASHFTNNNGVVFTAASSDTDVLADEDISVVGSTISIVKADVNPGIVTVTVTGTYSAESEVASKSFTITCTAAVRNLESIAITTASSDVEFETGSKFTITDLVVTGSFDAAPLEEDVTAGCTFKLWNGSSETALVPGTTALSTAGNFTVRISHSDSAAAETLTYQIVVATSSSLTLNDTVLGGSYNYGDTNLTSIDVSLNANLDSTVDLESYGISSQESTMQMNPSKGTYIKNKIAVPGKIIRIEMDWTSTNRTTNTPTVYFSSSYIDEKPISGGVVMSAGENNSAIATGNNYYFFVDGTTLGAYARCSELRVVYVANDTGAAHNFADKYLLMNSYDQGGSHGSTAGDNTCLTQYDIASAAYGNLTSDQKTEFAKLTAAVIRMEDWAIANGYTFNAASGTFTKNSRVPFGGMVSSETTNATIIIVVISLVSLTAVGGYFLLKKKKEQ